MTRRAHATLSASRREEDRLVEPRPLLGLVEHQGRIDNEERLAAERRRLQLAPCRHEAALAEDALRLDAQHEVIVEERGMRMRGAAGERDAVGARDRRRNNEP